jgi:hypothetical protein
MKTKANDTSFRIFERKLSYGRSIVEQKDRVTPEGENVDSASKEDSRG